jgi:hypothetical protein
LPKNLIMDKYAEVTLNRGMSFDVEVNGHKFLIDADEKVGGENRILVVLTLTEHIFYVTLGITNFSHPPDFSMKPPKTIIHF